MFQPMAKAILFLIMLYQTLQPIIIKKSFCNKPKLFFGREELVIAIGWQKSTSYVGNPPKCQMK